MLPARGSSADGRLIPDRDVEIVLDISRLIARIRHATPTGVDRVEMAYAAGLADRVSPDNLSYAAVHPSGVYGRVPGDAARTFLVETQALWEGRRAQPANPADRALTHLRRLWRVRPHPVPPRRAGQRRVYIQSSPHHLHREEVVRALLRRERAQFLCLLHDLIPIEYPEYARPGGAETHMKRIRTVARLADGVIANSDATARSFLPWLTEAGRSVPVATAHLGLESGDAEVKRPALVDDRPYFVCLGTIEPRKNHLLLLHIWRRLAEERGARAVPRLLVIGRRGWENEQVVDMLERCPALDGCVEEHGGLPDAKLRGLIAGARALLLPSFAEGYGMPVPEALALGVPVLCSDLPALREAGGDAPLYLDPLDGPGWTRAILALAEGEEARLAHRARIAAWQPPTWQEHIAIVLDQAARVAS